MPVGIGTTIAIGAIGAGTTAAASIYSANKQSDSAKTATDQQAKSNDAALAFEKQQAEAAYQSNESTRKANYDQWASREGTIAGVAGQHGLNVNIPGYVPSVDPNLNGTIAGATGSAPPAPGSPSQSGGSVPSLSALSTPSSWMNLVKNPQQLSAWVQQGLGPSANPGLVNYYVGKIQGQPGITPAEQAGGAAYWLQKIQSGGAPTGSIAGTMAPSSAPLGASAAPLQYKPGSIGATLQRF